MYQKCYLGNQTIFLNQLIIQKCLLYHISQVLNRVIAICSQYYIPDPICNSRSFRSFSSDRLLLVKLSLFKRIIIIRIFTKNSQAKSVKYNQASGFFSTINRESSSQALQQPLIFYLIFLLPTQLTQIQLKQREMGKDYQNKNLKIHPSIFQFLLRFLPFEVVTAFISNIFLFKYFIFNYFYSKYYYEY